jgi:hypothetical protein
VVIMFALMLSEAHERNAPVVGNNRPTVGLVVSLFSLSSFLSSGAAGCVLRTIELRNGAGSVGHF